MSDPTARVIDLTPELAAELLDRNPRNRRFSGRNFQTVKRAIERGEWELNGEAIKVATDGYMLDGQHRCRAVLETGKTIRTFLIEGLPPETQDTMDTGKSRTVASQLQIRGEKNATRLAAIITRLYAREKYGMKGAIGVLPQATIRERLQWFNENLWVRDIVEQVRSVQSKANFPGVALVAALMTEFESIDSEDSEFFWARMEDGANLDVDSPMIVLRKSLKTISDDTRGERNEKYIAALTIKAWNAYRAGETVGQLRWRAGGAKPEAFPEAK